MWLSLHIQLGADLYGCEIDRLLLDVVAPLSERLMTAGSIERFFFVRYADPESHLRLRLALPPGERSTTIEEQLAQAVADLDATAKVRQVDYEPEWERYGGHHGVAVAEEHFHLSSRTALALLAATADHELSRRFGKTLLTSVLLVHSLGGDRAATAKFLGRYSEHLVRQPHLAETSHRDTGPRGVSDSAADHNTATLGQALDALFTAADAGEGLGIPLLDQWLEGTAATVGRLRELQARGHLATPLQAPESQVLDSIVGSYLHMHHNRLGLSIPQEAHLASLAASALGGCPELSTAGVSTA